MPMIPPTLSELPSVSGAGAGAGVGVGAGVVFRVGVGVGIGVVVLVDVLVFGVVVGRAGILGSGEVVFGVLAEVVKVGLGVVADGRTTGATTSAKFGLATISLVGVLDVFEVAGLV